MTDPTAAAAERLRQRVLGRKDCQACLEMMVGSEAYLDGVARECLDYARHLITEPPQLITMTPEQAERFGRERITFGKHAGTEYRDVPREYLEWLADEALKLQSYLRALSQEPQP